MKADKTARLSKMLRLSQTTRLLGLYTIHMREDGLLQILLFLPSLAICWLSGRPAKGVWPKLILVLILFGLAGLGYCFSPVWLYSLGPLVLLAYTAFYDEDSFAYLVRLQLPFYLLSGLINLLAPTDLAIWAVPSLAACLLLAWKVAKFSAWLGLFPLLAGGLLLVPQPLARLLLTYLIFASLLAFYLLTSAQAATNAESFRRAVLADQYEEVKAIYLQMRGWRHDYHNHLQTMKAYLAQEQWEDLASYLDELEADLRAVDLLVKSGNPMVDAILNSKLSLAKQASIRLDLTVHVMDRLSISDTDLCIILGNLLDNAMEACAELEPDKRYIRLYLDAIGQQFYLSIQNSAKEILSFEEKHYISTKRGNHGLGLKRVALLIESYEGFLNLQNEPGIFAVEVSIPLEDQAR